MQNLSGRNCRRWGDAGWVWVMQQIFFLPKLCKTRCSHPPLKPFMQSLWELWPQCKVMPFIYLFFCLFIYFSGTGYSGVVAGLVPRDHVQGIPFSWGQHVSRHQELPLERHEQKSLVFSLSFIQVAWDLKGFGWHLRWFVAIIMTSSWLATWLHRTSTS